MTCSAGDAVLRISKGPASGRGHQRVTSGKGVWQLSSKRHRCQCPGGPPSPAWEDQARLGGARARTLAQANSGLGACRNSAGCKWLRLEGSATAGEGTVRNMPPAVKPQSGQWSMWFTVGAPELSPCSAVSTTICFMPSGVQISLKIESPRAWFSACEIVGANASPKIASMAIVDKRRRR